MNEWSAHNDGICLSIEPQLDGESIEEYDYSIEGTKYVGFFNNKTNTFFMPYVESRCEEYICDNRYNFTIGQTNKLYLVLIFNNFAYIYISAMKMDLLIYRKKMYHVK